MGFSSRNSETEPSEHAQHYSTPVGLRATPEHGNPGSAASLAFQRCLQTAFLDLLSAVDGNASVGTLRTAESACLGGHKDLICELIDGDAV